MHKVQLPSDPTSGLNSTYSIHLMSLFLPSHYVLFFGKYHEDTVCIYVFFSPTMYRACSSPT